MTVQTIQEILGGNSYPGRGILTGLSPDSKYAVAAYFIMGRSENSRNRVFEADGEGVRTQAKDPRKLTDPSLIIYAPVRMIEDGMVVSNGDHTDTIVDALREGDSFSDALEKRCYEPDAPNYTPRIASLLSWTDSVFTYKMSILKKQDDKGDECSRFFFQYGASAGLGHLIHTYKHDGEVLPPFEGEPVCVHIPGNIDELAETLWDSLDRENRISLFVRYIDLSDRTYLTRIINRFERDA